MSGVTRDWLVIFALMFGGSAFTAIEIWWLTRRSGSDPVRSVAFSFLTNCVAMFFGSAAAFVVFAVIFAMAWDGSLGTVPGGEYTIAVLSVVGSLTPLAVVISAKIVLIKLLGLNRIARPWVYAFVASLIFLGFIFVPPFILIYTF